MSSASGASGRVDGRVDANPTAGGKRKPPQGTKHCDSYLQRYREQQQRKKQQNKTNLTHVVRDQSAVQDGLDEVKAEKPQLIRNTEDDAFKEPSPHYKPPKSQLCVIL